VSPQNIAGLAAKEQQVVANWHTRHKERKRQGVAKKEVVVSGGVDSTAAAAAASSTADTKPLDAKSPNVSKLDGDP